MIVEIVRWIEISLIAVSLWPNDGSTSRGESDNTSKEWLTKNQLFGVESYLEETLRRVVGLSHYNASVYFEDKCPSFGQRVIGSLDLTAEGPTVRAAHEVGQVMIWIYCLENVTLSYVNNFMKGLMASSTKYLLLFPIILMKENSWITLLHHAVNLKAVNFPAKPIFKATYSFLQWSLFGKVDEAGQVQSFVFGMHKSFVFEPSLGLKLLDAFDVQPIVGGPESFTNIFRVHHETLIRKCDFVYISDEGDDLLRCKHGNISISLRFVLVVKSRNLTGIAFDADPVVAFARVPILSAIGELWRELLQPTIVVPVACLAGLVSWILALTPSPAKSTASMSASLTFIKRIFKDVLFYLLASSLTTMPSPEGARQSRNAKWTIAVGLWLLVTPVLLCMIRANITSLLQGLPRRRLRIFHNCEPRRNYAIRTSPLEAHDVIAYQLVYPPYFSDIEALVSGEPICYRKAILEAKLRHAFPRLNVYPLQPQASFDMLTYISGHWIHYRFMEPYPFNTVAVNASPYSTWRFGAWLSRYGFQQRIFQRILNVTIRSSKLVERYLLSDSGKASMLTAANFMDSDRERFLLTLTEAGGVITFIICGHAIAMTCFLLERISMLRWTRLGGF